MSAITQFFPSGGGGGGGGNETPTGIKIPADGIPVEILGVSAGGGGGNPYGAPGGSGAVFHATNYAVQPGCTVPITIGTGGPIGGTTGSCPNGQGGQGGTTSFNYPVLPLSVVGGGGGGTIGGPNGTGTVYGGCPGGNGGGGAGLSFQGGYSISSLGGDGCYYQSCNYKEVAIHKCAELNIGAHMYAGDYSFLSVGSEVLKECTACGIQYPWGIKAGYPGSIGERYHSPINTVRYFCGCGGGSGGNGYSIYHVVSACLTCSTHEFCGFCSIAPTTYKTDIAGDLTGINGPGTFGAPGAAGSQGGDGGLIIKWSTAFGASPSIPGTAAHDISPDTPGYHTYCFTSSGSIVLP